MPSNIVGFSGSLSAAGVPLITPNVRQTQVYTYAVTTPPAALPISLALVKEHLRLDPSDTSQDAYLTLLIEAARDFFEKFTGRTLINTSFKTFFDCFRQSFELAQSRFQSLDGFNYLVEGTPTVVPVTSFYVTAEDIYSRIVFPFLDDLPTNKDDEYQSIIVDLTAGYGTSDTAIPSDIKLALLNHVAALYENRGDCGACDCSDINNLPVATQNTYRQYDIVTLYGSPFRG